MRICILILIILFIPSANPNVFEDFFAPVGKFFVNVVVAGVTIAEGCFMTVITGGAALPGAIANIGIAIANVGSSFNDILDAHEMRMEREAEELRNKMELKRREENNQQQNENIDKLNKQVASMRKAYNEQMRPYTKTLNDQRIQLDHFASALYEFDITVAKNFGDLKNTIDDVGREIEQQLMEIYDHTNTALKHLDRNIAHQFRAISNLKVELQFTEEIMLETDVLERLMVQTMRFPAKDTNEEFLDQYRIKGPRQIIMDLSNRLKYKYTNSIASAMELNIFKSKKIYERWIANIGHIVYKLLTVEGFYFGLSEYSKYPANNISLSYYDPTFDAVKNLLKELKKFGETFKINPDVYWPDLVSYNIEDMLQTHSGREHVADEIETLLGQIYTTDVFTIHVAETENGQKFENTMGVLNTTHDKPIDVKDFFAVSPDNRKAAQPQLTFFNPNNDLAISVVRSESHHKRTENEKFMINEIFYNTIPTEHSSLSDHKEFNKLLIKMNQDMGGEIGGAVISKKPIAERITNGASSVLHWYNQVPGHDEYVNMMWI